MFLNDCKDIIDQQITDVWINTLTGLDDQNAAYIELITRIDSISDDFFYKLNLSVLSAEYLKNEFNEALSSLVTSFDNKILVDQKTVENDQANRLADSLLNGFILPVKKL